MVKHCVIVIVIIVFILLILYWIEIHLIRLPKKILSSLQ